MQKYKCFSRLERIGFFIYLAVFAGVLTPGYAAITHGVVDEDYLNGGLYRMTCDAFDHPGAYCVCDNGFDDTMLSFDQIAVEYDYDYEDSDTLYMSNCVVLDTFCSSKRYMETSGDMSWCSDCPVGLAASEWLDAMHFNPSCTYCAAGFYGTAPNCQQCPNGGTTEDNNQYNITDCYTLTPAGTQSDITGSFVHSPAGQRCWWKN